MGGLLKLQMHKSNPALTARILWGHKSTTVLLGIPKHWPQDRTSRESPGTIGSGCVRPGALLYPSICSRLLSLPTAPSCLPLSAVSPASWLRLTQSSFSPQQASLASPHRDPSGSLCSSLILCVILKKKIQMSQFLFSEQDVKAPWCI